MNAIQWSPQQSAFINEARNGTSSIVLIAVAGAGKTTTILEAADQLRGNAIILAYNKKIADEIKAKLKKRGVDWKRCEASTTHSIGLRNYKRTVPGVIVKGDKVGAICASWVEEDEIDITLVPHTSVICHLVSLAKANAVGVPGQGHIDDTSIWEDIVDHFDLFDEEPLQKKADKIIEVAISLLKASNDMRQVVDFDDMIYLPLLFQINFFQFDNVVMDEAQDANVSRKLLADALLKDNGRFFGVGDPRQAIYGFTGADNESMENLKEHFDCKEMPLTVTYRCPKSIVRFAQTWVNHIQAHESAPQGTVTAMTFEDFMLKRELHYGDSAILCRNTRPLVTAAFALIRQNIPCRIEGRNIGEALIKLATRWRSITTIPELEDKLEEWLDAESVKWIAKKKMAKVQEAEDKVETLKVVMEACQERKQHLITDVVNYINSIFADNVTGILTLSTIHKSKGREWKYVFWLDRFATCPSKYASQPWEIIQEQNLCYVAATRSMDTLVDLNPPMPKQKAVNDNVLQPKEQVA
ncbi:UvrD-helicase domain-containing protein [Bradyrhizobium ottawaense]|uniref:DNA 3'-5' helicase n=1 Tax=Bradyrhizobium ottawaense TaxID=931866 RepID=A0ABY0QHF1_9BRAD|nr:ATP-dependent helicase [Bradyrhizobium ottawaense]SDK44802.1 Superfamily I DNA or RNA helicase [Bradyrhizobium ottawaense]